MFEREGDISYIPTSTKDYYEKLLNGIDAIIQEMNDIIHGQESIREMLSSMSVVPVPDYPQKNQVAQVMKELSELEAMVQPEVKAPAPIVESITEVELPEEKEKATVESESEKTSEPESESVVVTGITTKSGKPRKVYNRSASDAAESFIIDFLGTEEKPVSELNGAAMEKDRPFCIATYNRVRQQMGRDGRLIERYDQCRRKYVIRQAGAPMPPEPERESITDPIVRKNKTAQVRKAQQPSYLINPTTIQAICNVRPLDYDHYQKKANNLAWAIVQLAPKGTYKTSSSVYKDIYDTMTKQYGVCWSQLSKEAKRAGKLDRAPHRMEVCYGDETTRSIFMAKLEDLAMNLVQGISHDVSEKEKQDMAIQAQKIRAEKNKNKEENPITDYDLNRVIRPLALKRLDVSSNYSNTWDVVFHAMSSKVSWSAGKRGHKNWTKRHIIKANADIYKVFCETVNELMAA